MIDPWLAERALVLEQIGREGLGLRWDDPVVKDADARGRLVQKEILDRYPRRDPQPKIGTDGVLTYLETAPVGGLAVELDPLYFEALIAAPDRLKFRDRIDSVMTAAVLRGLGPGVEAAVAYVHETPVNSIRDSVQSRSPAASDPLVQAGIDRFLWRTQPGWSSELAFSVPSPTGEPDAEVVSLSRRLLEYAADADEKPTFINEPRGPASDKDIERLRAALAPHPLPAALEAMLRVTQDWQLLLLWPDPDVGLEWGVDRLIDTRGDDSFVDFAPAPPNGLLPIGYSSHEWTYLELVDHREPCLMQHGPGWGAPVIRAPSLRAVLERAIEFFESGERRPYIESTDGASSVELERARQDREARSFARHGWRDAPWSPNSPMPERGYPSEWFTPLRPASAPS